MSSNTKQLWLSSQKTFFLKHFFFFCWLKKSLGKSIKPFFSAETKKHQQCVKKTKTSQSKRLLREKRSWPFFSKFKKYLPSKEFEQKNEKNEGLVKVWQKKIQKTFWLKPPKSKFLTKKKESWCSCALKIQKHSTLCFSFPKTANFQLQNLQIKVWRERWQLSKPPKTNKRAWKGYYTSSHSNLATIVSAILNQKQPFKISTKSTKFKAKMASNYVNDTSATKSCF